MKKILLRWFWSLIEYLMFIPVILIVAGLVLPTNYALVFTLTLPLHTLVAIIVTVLLKRFKNMLALIIGAIYVFVVSCIWLLTSSVTPEHMLLYTLGSAFFFYWGIRRGISGGSSLFFYTGGLVIHGLSLLIIGKSPVLNPLFNIAFIVAVFYVIAALPVANRHYLITESQQKNSLNTMPNSVIRGNWIIIISIFIVVGILSIGNFLIEGLRYLLRALDYLVKYIWGVINYFLQGGENPEEPFFEEVPTLLEENPVAELISNIIITAVFVFVSYLIIRYLIKHRKEIINNFIGFFTRIFNRFQKWGEIEKNYTDKQEFIIQTEKNMPLYKKNRKREKQWKDMKDNLSRIRFIYTKFVLNNIKKGYKFNSSDTPSETVERIIKEVDEREENHELINEAYNSVRYGIFEIGDDTVRILKDKYL